MNDTYENAATTKARMEKEIVTQTLDKLNSGQFSGKSRKKHASAQEAMSNTYDLSKSILSAAYEDKGSIVGAES